LMSEDLWSKLPPFVRWFVGFVALLLLLELIVLAAFGIWLLAGAIRWSSTTFALVSGAASILGMALALLQVSLTLRQH
jgi:hypothetical protein